MPAGRGVCAKRKHVPIPPLPSLTLVQGEAHIEGSELRALHKHLHALVSAHLLVCRGEPGMEEGTGVSPSPPPPASLSTPAWVPPACPVSSDLETPPAWSKGSSKSSEAGRGVTGCRATGSSRASSSCQPLLSPREGTPWGLTRHKGEVDGAGKTLSLRLQPPDSLEVPVGRRHHGGEGPVCPEPSQWGSSSGNPSPRDHGDGSLPSCITRRHPHAVPAPPGTCRALHSLNGDTLHVLGTPGVDVALRVLNSLEGWVGPVLLWGTAAVMAQGHSGHSARSAATAGPPRHARPTPRPIPAPQRLARRRCGS